MRVAACVVCVCMCVRMCLSILGLLITSSVMWCDMDLIMVVKQFYIFYMAVVWP